MLSALNLHNEFSDRYKVELNGVEFTSRTERLWREIGLGGTIYWNNDKYSLYGEVSASTGLEDFGESHRFAGTVGMRVRW